MKPKEAFEIRMIDSQVTRSAIFSEFTKEEQEQYFSRNDNCVRTHIDTLYYSVSIVGDKNYTEDAGMLAMLAELLVNKQRKQASPQEHVEYFGLSAEIGSFSGYEYRLSLPEMYDIFVARWLPNDDTPRIVVQLRTRSLVLDGPRGAIEKSFDHVVKLLDAYGLRVREVKENRVDYAYHTNIIQNPMAYFNDDRLVKNLSSTLSIYTKYGNVGEEITLDTLNLGSRRSNNVYFRCYNKTREVVEKAYKSFFIEKWQKDGLISEYDRYVLEYAYGTGSFRSGILVGQCKWYIEYGKSEIRKQQLAALIQKCHVNSDNNHHLDKEIKNMLPPITTIMNVEFQTKRKFYLSFNKQLETVAKDAGAPKHLERLFAILLLREAIQKYLTDKSVSFIMRNADGEKEMAAWWKRIHSCKITDVGDYDGLIREKENGTDIEKTKRRIYGAIAHLSILRNRSTDERSFQADIQDALSYFNDNDFYGFAADPDGNDVEIHPKEYDNIRKRKARQDKALVSSFEAENKKISAKVAKSCGNIGRCFHGQAVRAGARRDLQHKRSFARLQSERPNMAGATNEKRRNSKKIYAAL